MINEFKEVLSEGKENIGERWLDKIGFSLCVNDIEKLVTRYNFGPKQAIEKLYSEVNPYSNFLSAEFFGPMEFLMNSLDKKQDNIGDSLEIKLAPCPRYMESIINTVLIGEDKIVKSSSSLKLENQEAVEREFGGLPLGRGFLLKNNVLILEDKKYPDTINFENFAKVYLVNFSTGETVRYK